MDLVKLFLLYFLVLALYMISNADTTRARPEELSDMKHDVRMSKEEVYDSLKNRAKEDEEREAASVEEPMEPTEPEHRYTPVEKRR